MRFIAFALALCSIAIPSRAQIPVGSQTPFGVQTNAGTKKPLLHKREHIGGNIEYFGGDVQNFGIPKFNATGKTLVYVEVKVNTLHYKITNVDNRSCTVSSSTWIGNDPTHVGDAPCISVLKYQVPSGLFLHDSAVTYPIAYKTLAVSTNMYFPPDYQALDGVTTILDSPSQWSGMVGTSGDWNIQLTHSYTGGYGDTVNGGTNFTGTLNAFGWPLPYTGGCQETRYVVDSDHIDWDVFIDYQFTKP